MPRQARLVGYALSALSSPSFLPWHRVVNASGQISGRSSETGMDVLQRLRLERERVKFDLRGRIDLSRFQWKPRPAATERPEDEPERPG